MLSEFTAKEAIHPASVGLIFYNSFSVFDTLLRSGEQNEGLQGNIYIVYSTTFYLCPIKGLELARLILAWLFNMII